MGPRNGVRGVVAVAGCAALGLLIAVGRSDGGETAGHPQPAAAPSAGLDRLFDPKRGFFALGQPHQFVPPPSGWSIVVPPIPPRPGTAAAAKPAPPRPFRPLFFDNDFRYLEKPNNPYVDPFDVLKRRSLTPTGSVKLDFGGEFRWQSKREDNRRLNGVENNYNLFRERLYFDTWYEDLFRVYFETIWADSSLQTLPPIALDLNHGDLLNAFGEIKLPLGEGRSLSGRFGREELFFGNQRLVSALDWVNTRVKFDNVAHLLYRGPDWNVDGFWSRPLPPAPRMFDSPNQSVQFFGTYAVYKGFEGQTVDLYYLGLLETDPIVRGRGGVLGEAAAHTLGTRLQGGRGDWLYESEFAYQFGGQSNLDRSAGIATMGVGRRFSKAWAKPELWFYYDYASGDGDPVNGTFGTFNQLFPLGHKYFGYADLSARQNIRDPNVILTFAPSKRVNFLVWYHHFNLVSPRDALYNVAGAVSRRDPTGRAGTDVGDEIDLLMNVILNPHTDLQFNYSHFFPGSFIANTGVDKDSRFFYAQFLFRF